MLVNLKGVQFYPDRTVNINEVCMDVHPDEVERMDIGKIIMKYRDDIDINEPYISDDWLNQNISVFQFLRQSNGAMRIRYDIDNYIGSYPIVNIEKWFTILETLDIVISSEVYDDMLSSLRAITTPHKEMVHITTLKGITHLNVFNGLFHSLIYLDDFIIYRNGRVCKLDDGIRKTFNII